MSWPMMSIAMSPTSKPIFPVGLKGGGLGLLGFIGFVGFVGPTVPPGPFGMLAPGGKLGAAGGPVPGPDGELGRFGGIPGARCGNPWLLGASSRGVIGENGAFGIDPDGLDDEAGEDADGALGAADATWSSPLFERIRKIAATPP